MRSARPLVLGPLVLLLAACASSTPGWTYAPAPSMTPVPSASGDASAAPSGDASAAPSGEPSAAPSGGTGPVVELAATAIQFDQGQLTVPADTAFQLAFTNNDADIPHNIEIKDVTGAFQFQGDIFNGVATTTYAVPGLPAGEYTFLCVVHPNMVGTITAS